MVTKYAIVPMDVLEKSISAMDDAVNRLHHWRDDWVTDAEYAQSYDRREMFENLVERADEHIGELDFFSDQLEQCRKDALSHLGTWLTDPHACRRHAYQEDEQRMPIHPTCLIQLSDHLLGLEAKIEKLTKQNEELNDKLSTRQ